MKIDYAEKEREKFIKNLEFIEKIWEEKMNKRKERLKKIGKFLFHAAGVGICIFILLHVKFVRHWLGW